VYKLDFNKFEKEFRWNIQKKENVIKMFDILQSTVYPTEHNAEFALVAKSKIGAVDLIYETDSCFLFKVPLGFDPVQTGSAIDYFDRDGAKVVLIHNHPEGTNFSFFDFITFIRCDCVHEMFVDSDKIWYLRKHIGAYLNSSDKENAVIKLNQIFKETSITHKNDFELIDNDTTITSNEEKERKRSVLYFTIRSKTLKRALKEGVVKANFGAIEKIPV
jgi:hypothetical protein